MAWTSRAVRPRRPARSSADRGRLRPGRGLRRRRGQRRRVLVERLDRLLQLVLADRLLADLGELEDVVDDAVLEQRRADLLEAPAGSSGRTRRTAAPAPGTAAPARRPRAARSASGTVTSCLLPISASSSPSRTRRSASFRCSSVGSISPWSWPWWSWCSSCQSWWAICLASTSTSVGGTSKLTRSSSASISRRFRIARLACAYSSASRVADLLLQRIEALGPEARRPARRRSPPASAP